MPIAPGVSTAVDPLPIERGLRFAEPGQSVLVRLAARETRPRILRCGRGDRAVTARRRPQGSNDASEVMPPALRAALINDCFSPSSYVNVSAVSLSKLAAW